MPPRLSIPVLVCALVLVLPMRAGAATVLGSPDVDAARETFLCAPMVRDCGNGTVGFRQLTLTRAMLHAPDSGVVVSARIHASRSGGNDPTTIVVLRPAAQGNAATIVASAPLPVGTQTGLHEAPELHLPMAADDSLGIMFPAGQVNLGVRRRQAPDGGLVRFAPGCNPCGEDAGTGIELLFEAVLEPDFDGDGLGDESQDPDGGGLFGGDDLGGFDAFGDDDFPADEPAAERPRVRLVRVVRARKDAMVLVLAVSRPGRLNASSTVDVRKRGRRTVASGEARAKEAGRVRLRLEPSRLGRRLLSRRDRLGTRLEVSFRPRTGRRQTLTRRLVLR
jgi:hypothetical protein